MNAHELVIQLESVLEKARMMQGSRSKNATQNAGLGKVLTNQAELNALTGLFHRSARQCIDAFDNRDHCDGTKGQSPTQALALARGVQYRVVYHRSVFIDDDSVESIDSAVLQGEEARVSDFVTHRLYIKDRREVLIVAQNFPQAHYLGLYTAHPMLTEYVTSVFESVWRVALPIYGKIHPNQETLTKDEQQLVRLLMLGRTDVSIAQTLGVSHRTVQRHIQSLQTRLGARGRLQLGIQLGLRFADRNSSVEYDPEKVRSSIEPSMNQKSD